MRHATGTILLLCLVLGAGAQAQAEPSAGDGAARLGEAHQAFADGDFEQAYRLASALDPRSIINGDYVLHIRARSAYLSGRSEKALTAFQALARDGRSRFQSDASWGSADCLWQLGRYGEAQTSYRRLLQTAVKARRPNGDVGLARFRIAAADKQLHRNQQARGSLQRFRLEHPEHPLVTEAEDMLHALGGEQALALSPGDRITRAHRLNDEHLWHESIAELRLIPDSEPKTTLRERDFATAMTLFKMRRRYKDAADLLLGLYKQMESRAAEALFHGARALSRADFDTEAIRWYQTLVEEYPRSAWAAEAQFLSGWLEFNLGNYRRAVPHLETTIARFGRSRWVTAAEWFLGFSYFMLGEHQRALPVFEALAKDSDPLEGGKGRYWAARCLRELGRADESIASLRALVGRYPFSWYALLAQGRLREHEIEISPLGDNPSAPEKVTPIDTAIDERLAADPLIKRCDELLAAGLPTEAGFELRRGEKAFLRRTPRAAAWAILMERYRRAGDFNRPWMLAVVHGGARSLNAEPSGPAGIWWRHAYPQAFEELVEKWRHLGASPKHYLHAIMRKESGFDPNVLSYADAMGLLQMIPATTKRVAKALSMEYTTDLLYNPELNVKTGSWYIGHLLHKFKGQIPIGAGSFNSGPRPVMRWLQQNGKRPIDEFVELVPYQQTREYMKKVTESYARYVFLYTGESYQQPLTVDADYVVDGLTY